MGRAKESHGDRFSQRYAEGKLRPACTEFLGLFPANPFHPGVTTVLWVGLGSALGGSLRYLAAGWVQRRWPHSLPVGTMAVNITGCFAMGLLAGLRAPGGEPWLKPDWREFLLTGVLGGYTTFSAFSLQTLALYRDGHPGLAVFHVVASVLACMGAVIVGYTLGRAMTAS